MKRKQLSMIKVTLVSYRDAWKKYKKGKDYAHSVQVLKAMGSKQPYCDNIIEGIFAAGFNSVDSNL
jgi:hypothetical protein